MGFFSKFVKRRIPLKLITAITLSEKSSEFLLHVPAEYDYRFSHANKRPIIIVNLVKAILKATNQLKFKMFFVKDVNLTEYVTTEALAKKKISKMPKSGGNVKKLL